MDLNALENLYNESLKKHGLTSKAVGWNTSDCQNLRFEKLIQVIKVPFEKLSVQELGSGYGEFFNFLISKNLPIEKYIGYDISLKMTQAAQSYISDARAKFIQSSRLTEQTDYCFASGIFNVKLDHSQKTWEKHILDTLHHISQSCKKGFAFNLLSTQVDYQEPHLFYGDPEWFLKHCQKHFSKDSQLITDYPLYEWTITVQH